MVVTYTWLGRSLTNWNLFHGKQQVRRASVSIAQRVCLCGYRYATHIFGHNMNDPHRCSLEAGPHTPLNKCLQLAAGAHLSRTLNNHEFIKQCLEVSRNGFVHG